MKKLIFCFCVLMGIVSLVYAQTKKKPDVKSSELIVSCSAEYVQPETIEIWWAESDYSFPAAITDGFHNKLYWGTASANAFVWDRGANIARLDRYTGLLSLTPKDGGNEVTAKCVKVEKKF